MSRKSGGSPPSIRPPILDDEDNVNTDRDDPKYRRASVPDNISQGQEPHMPSTADLYMLIYFSERTSVQVVR